MLGPFEVLALMKRFGSEEDLGDFFDMWMHTFPGKRVVDFETVTTTRAED